MPGRPYAGGQERRRDRNAADHDERKHPDFAQKCIGQTTVDPSCYCQETLILTDRGQAAVETLRLGDLLATGDGVAKPVRWIGWHTVSPRFANPLRCWPIRIRAGALAENVPSGDLRLSPDHALLVDGVLIQAGALVNGTSIVRETEAPETFVYYHVECDDPSLIVAEGALAEPFSTMPTA